MKKHKKIIILIIIIAVVCTFFALSIVGTFRLGYTLGNGLAVRKQIQEEVERVERFFEKGGYEIKIIGAHTNGREHEGPFLYGWYWKSFEIGPEVVMLYYYDERDEIDGYIMELDDKTKNKCYISEHFVFYYGGNDIDIINTIKEFCKLYLNYSRLCHESG